MQPPGVDHDRWIDPWDGGCVLEENILECGDSRSQGGVVALYVYSGAISLESEGREGRTRGKHRTVNVARSSDLGQNGKWDYTNSGSVASLMIWVGMRTEIRREMVRQTE